MDWERKLENANLDNHMQFLQNVQLTATNHPLEVTAWEIGYVPEAQGLPSDQLATRRRYSVAHVVRPRTNSTNACLCFTLLSKLSEHKPWKRAAGEKDPSRGIILDLQEKCDWKMPATVMMHTNEIALSLDDSLQVQCLPVYRTDGSSEVDVSQGTEGDSVSEL